MLISQFRTPLLIGIVVLAGGGAWLAHQRALASAAKPAARDIVLPVVAVARRDIRELLSVSGEFRPYQEVELDAKLRGYVAKLDADVGDSVKSGAELARLEVPEAQADLAHAEASLAVARQQADRANAQYLEAKSIDDRLHGVKQERPELIAQQDLDEAQAKADAGLAALTAARSAISEAEANLRRERDLAAYIRITAPFTGVVTRRYVDEGALVGAAGGSGNAMFHLSDIDRLRLVINVPESSVPEVIVGRKARIAIAALGATIEAPVARVSHQLAMDTRTMHVEIDVANADHRIAAGMYAEVSLPLQERSQALAIPLRSLHAREGDQARVYVLGADGRAAVREVRVGLNGADEVEISDGLGPGELVAVDVVPDTTGGVHYAARRIDPAG
jgi:RND family efflux transporter MFP subunit